KPASGRKEAGTAATSIGSSKIWTPRSIGLNLSARRGARPTGGETTSMVKLDLPYLWAPMGRKRRYWFYRRNGRHIPITSPDGRRLQQGEPGFFEGYERIHQNFAV